MPSAAFDRKKRRRPVSPVDGQLQERQRTDPYSESEPSASHLVSFLTGYDRAVSPTRSHSGSSDSGRSHGHGDDDEEDDDGEDDVDDPDDEDHEEGEGVGAGPPTKRARTGLTSSTSTPSKAQARRSTTATPKKRTPRKPKRATDLTSPFMNGASDGPLEGFIRASKADAYFLSHARSSRTSGNSYSSLVTPLSQAQYEQFSSSSAEKSASIVSLLEERFTHRFDQWELELEEGFNLLFYGFGSKRGVINRFVAERLKYRGHCVVVNGLFPQLGIRDVVGQIEEVLGIQEALAEEAQTQVHVPAWCSTPLDRSVYRLYTYFSARQTPPSSHEHERDDGTPPASKRQPLYLILHNIDSASLRLPRSLAILSLLASSPHIHIIATFDHLNTPLLFSTTTSTLPPHLSPSSTPTPSSTATPSIPASRSFNWIYHNLTTFAPYTLELSHLRLSTTPLSSSSTLISEPAVLQILASVPPMALRLLKLLLTRQLASLPREVKYHSAHGERGGVAPPFATDVDILQTLSREKFIAREKERYDALIGEFKDHGLVLEAAQVARYGGDGEGGGDGGGDGDGVRGGGGDRGGDGEDGVRTGRWVWVPLSKAGVERVLVSLEGVEV